MTQALSNGLASWLKQNMAADGPIPFERFMHWALYHPEYGYYQQCHGIWGKDGDYVTAPSANPWFGVIYAHIITHLLGNKPFSIVEYGPGEGQWCHDLLTTLAEFGHSPRHYLWRECSQQAAARVQTIADGLPNEVGCRPRLWTEDREPPFDDDEQVVILANEYLDALPVHSLCEKNGHLYERYVTYKDEGFGWHDHPNVAPTLAEHWQRCRQDHWPDHYCSEINPGIPSWFAELERYRPWPCVALIHDYGLVRRDYYHPERANGTLRAFYRHQLCDDVLAQPGTQDITAHVDFTHVAEQAHIHHWRVEAFTTQQHWLMGPWFLPACTFSQQHTSGYDWQQQVKRLTMPSQMGDIFKVMALSRPGTNSATMALGAIDEIIDLRRRLL